MAMVYDPETLGADSSEELLEERPPQALQPRTMRKAAVVGLALLGVAAVAVLTAPARGPAAGALSAQEAKASGLVGLAQELMGTLSTGVSANLKPAELTGCCPMMNGRYLACCSHKDQCCPTQWNSSVAPLGCCASQKVEMNLTKCIGSLVSTWCPTDGECCNGRCASKGSTCCGDVICGPSDTCCKNALGAYSCGSATSKCGGPQGGAPLRHTDWPNPSTPLEWWNTSKNHSIWGKTIFREKANSSLPLTPQECANNCGLSGSCCGKICCSRGATCCQNEFKVHSCGAVGSVCGGQWGGAPLHEDTAGYVEPYFGKTVFRAIDDQVETEDA